MNTSKLKNDLQLHKVLFIKFTKHRVGRKRNYKLFSIVKFQYISIYYCNNIQHSFYFFYN